MLGHLLFVMLCTGGPAPVKMVRNVPAEVRLRLISSRKPNEGVGVQMVREGGEGGWGHLMTILSPCPPRRDPVRGP